MTSRLMTDEEISESGRLAKFLMSKLKEFDGKEDHDARIVASAACGIAGAHIFGVDKSIKDIIGRSFVDAFCRYADLPLTITERVIEKREFVLHDGEDEQKTEELHAFMAHADIGALVEQWEGHGSGIGIWIDVNAGDTIVFKTVDGVTMLGVRRKA